MTTPRRRALVSPLAAISLALALGACAPATTNLAARPSPAEAAPAFIRFDNDAREHVHVYLAGERREWLLGRVEPGANALLRIPAASLADGSGLVRIVVLTGQTATLRAVRDPRASVTLAQPASDVLLQHWRFTQGALTSLRLARPLAEVPTG